jgi:hypothetical protein
MSADMATAIGYLKRTASHASYQMTVDTSMVRKLLLAADAAEAGLRYQDEIRQWDYDIDPSAVLDAARGARNAALDTYREATR